MTAISRRFPGRAAAHGWHTATSKVSALVHWRIYHPRDIKSDWDLHGHPHHEAFSETALMSREMQRL